MHSLIKAFQVQVYSSMITSINTHITNGDVILINMKSDHFTDLSISLTSVLRRPVQQHSEARRLPRALPTRPGHSSRLSFLMALQSYHKFMLHS